MTTAPTITHEILRAMLPDVPGWQRMVDAESTRRALLAAFPGLQLRPCPDWCPATATGTGDRSMGAAGSGPSAAP